MRASRSPSRPSGRASSLALAGGVLAVIGCVWIALITATPLGGPNWVRALGSALLPIGALVAIIAGVVGLRGGGRRRGTAIAGMVAAALALGGFVILITVYA